MDRRKLAGLGLLALGAALAVFAGAVSGAAIERTLLGHTTGELSWGPALFRVVLAANGLALALVGARMARKRASAPPDARAIPDATRSASSAGRRGGWLPWLALGVLTILAIGLRLWRLNSCLWFDEVLTLLDFVRPPLGAIVTNFQSQNQHMLYSILGHLSVRWFGESAWALRLPAVAFGVASIWALFLLGRHLVGRLEALLACTLMTFSYHEIWFSQNARGYTALLLFATLATWLWLEAISHGAWRWWIYYALALFLGLWVHLTMVFVPLAHGVVYLAPLMLRRLRPGLAGGDHSGALSKPVAAWLLGASLTLQVYALSLPEFLRTAAREGVGMQTEWTNPLWVVQATLRGLQVGWSGLAVVALGGFLALAGWLSIFRRNWQAATVLVLPAVLGGASMLTLGHPLWPRFFFFSLGFALLIVVRGAMTVPRVVFAPFKPLRSPEGLTTTLGLTVAGLMIAASTLTLPRDYALPKQDFTGARDYVEQQRKPGEAVVAVGLAGIAYSRYFEPRWQIAQTPEALEALQRDHPRIWLIYTLPIQLRAQNYEFWQMVETQYQIVRVFPGTLGGGDIYVCRERPKSATLGPEPTTSDKGRQRSSQEFR